MHGFAANLSLNQSIQESKNQQTKKVAIYYLLNNDINTNEMWKNGWIYFFKFFQWLTSPGTFLIAPSGALRWSWTSILEVARRWSDDRRCDDIVLTSDVIVSREFENVIKFWEFKSFRICLICDIIYISRKRRKTLTLLINNKKYAPEIAHENRSTL